MTLTAEPALGSAHLADVDPDLWGAMLRERDRQRNKIELIASENYVFAAVMEAQGSWLTNKYAEGQPGRRYYGGCEFVDEVETLAEERALALFPGAEFVNVQPHSGAQANMAAYLSVLSMGDRVLGMNLAHGGHLTHGSPVNFSGQWYDIQPYGVREDNQQIDYDALERQALEVRPKMIVAGASAYPRIIDFERMGRIARAADALLFVDMAHVAGLVAAGVHPEPVPARGPRHDDHPQDAPRPARRHDLRSRRTRQSRRQGGVPGNAGRPAHARDRRQGGRAPPRGHRRVPRRSAPNGRERVRPRDARWRRTARSWSPAARTTT